MSPMPEAPKSELATATGEEFAALRKAGHSRTFAAGTTIFSIGDPGDGFYLVESGQVIISAVFGDNEPRMLAVIGPGDYFGEMAALDDAPRSATARAEVDTSTLFLSRDELLQLLDSRPRLALNLIREFSKRMRAINRKYVEEIIQAERLGVVGRFASTIVHDFKNPLNIISLAVDLVGSPDMPPATRATTRGHIIRQVERMTNMLNELIEFSRPTGRLPALTAVNFSQYFQRLVDELRPELAERGIGLELADPVPVVEVKIAPQRLSRLFHNLAANSADAMRRGGRVTFHFAVEGNQLRIDVSDNGTGIAPEIAGQLFQPFASHGKKNGTGLGLSICRKIAEDHGGHITARSNSGPGATFTLTLPLLP